MVMKSLSKYLNPKSAWHPRTNGLEDLTKESTFDEIKDILKDAGFQEVEPNKSDNSCIKWYRRLTNNNDGRGNTKKKFLAMEYDNSSMHWWVRLCGPYKITKKNPIYCVEMTTSGPYYMSEYKSDIYDDTYFNRISFEEFKEKVTQIV